MCGNLHRSARAGEKNFVDEQIANLDESTAHRIKLSANEDGSFRVMNGRTGVWKRHPIHPIVSAADTYLSRAVLLQWPYNRVAVKVTVNQYRVHFHFHEPWCVEVFRVNLYLENLDESSRYRTT
jgi:hypothetical protein